MRHTANLTCADCGAEVSVTIEIARTYRGVETEVVDMVSGMPLCQGSRTQRAWCDLAFDDYVLAVHDRTPLHPYDQMRRR